MSQSCPGPTQGTQPQLLDRPMWEKLQVLGALSSLQAQRDWISLGKSLGDTPVLVPAPQNHPGTALGQVAVVGLRESSLQGTSYPMEWKNNRYFVFCNISRDAPRMSWVAGSAWQLLALGAWGFSFLLQNQLLLGLC